MFDNRYQVVLADTDDGKRIHYNLRYKIYCLEKKYEDTDEFSEQMEIDQYDDKAVHFLIRDKQTGEWLATVRLVIGALQQLPIREAANIEKDKLDAVDAEFGEISRFSILQNYRNKSVTSIGAEESIKVPELMFGLFRAIFVYGKFKGIKHWLFLCKRPFKRILKKYGFSLQEIGPKCNYHGIRYPYSVSIEKSLGKLQQIAPRLSSNFNKKDKAYYTYSELFGIRESRAA